MLIVLDNSRRAWCGTVNHPQNSGQFLEPLCGHSLPKVTVLKNLTFDGGSKGLAWDRERGVRADRGIEVKGCLRLRQRPLALRVSGVGVTGVPRL